MSGMVEPESIGMDSVRLQGVTDWLSEQVSSTRLAGCSALIGRRGSIGYFEAAGDAIVESRQRFDLETIVRIYSMTKPVTTVAAMMLYEQGCFQLDDPIALYLPEFSDTAVWLGGKSPITDVERQKHPITVRQLMTHTSGLTYSFMHSNELDKLYRDEGLEFPGATVTLEEMVNRLAAVPLLCQPGAQWNYSVSTDVLGRLVEVWSGLSLQQYFTQAIFEPLSMHSTGFHVAKDKLSRFGALYGPGSGKELGSVATASGDPLRGPAPPSGVIQLEGTSDNRFTTDPVLYSGGGGLTSSILDYSRFCRMLLNKGEFEGVRLLGRKTVEYMRLNHLPGNSDMAGMGQPVWSETSYEGIGFGLGFAVVLDPVRAQIITSPGEHHWGGAASTFFWIDPAEDLFVVFFAQLLPSSTYPLRRELRARVYQSLTD